MQIKFLFMAILIAIVGEFNLSFLEERVEQSTLEHSSSFIDQGIVFPSLNLIRKKVSSLSVETSLSSHAFQDLSNHDQNFSSLEKFLITFFDSPFISQIKSPVHFHIGPPAC